MDHQNSITQKLEDQTSVLKNYLDNAVEENKSLIQKIHTIVGNNSARVDLIMKDKNTLQSQIQDLRQKALSL